LNHRYKTNEGIVQRNRSSPIEYRFFLKLGFQFYHRTTETLTLLGLPNEDVTVIGSARRPEAILQNIAGYSRTRPTLICLTVDSDLRRVLLCLFVLTAEVK
jgi:predicted lactoylglutathione lyase